MGVVKRAAERFIKLKYNNRRKKGNPPISNKRIQQFQQLYAGMDAYQATYEHETGQLAKIIKGMLSYPLVMTAFLYINQSYKVPFSRDNLYIFLLGMVAIILIYFVNESKLTERIKKRNLEMLLDYSEIVAKLTILMDCGMTVKGAFTKIAADYSLRVELGLKEKRYAYEEMYLSVHMMENGVYEGKAYGTFAMRCRLHPYVKLGRLLEQNIKMGNKHMKMLLEHEVEEAFESRKNLAKRLGEEAGTKLLIPMIIMLFLVLVIILVPAFISFSI